MDDKYLKYQAVNSPSKIDQWCKPKPAAKLVLALVRRSPLMLKERCFGIGEAQPIDAERAGWGEYENSSRFRPSKKVIMTLTYETHYDHGMVPAHGNGGTKD